jgi:hypothetical protein
VGNFPQAFSHVSLVNTAAGLSHVDDMHPVSHAARISGMKLDSHKLHKLRRRGRKTASIRKAFHHEP